MNGVALLVALSVLGVDYKVQTAEDGKLEYVVQMEPELLKALADGAPIHSAVPAEVGVVERVLIRVGLTEPRHTQTNITAYRSLLVSAGRTASIDGRGAADPTATIVWPSKTKPELNYNVQHGWQPDTQGVLSYYVQIDPALLQTLAVGDEIRAGVDPAAGRIGRFVIQAGSDQLPRIAAEPVATVRTDAGAGRSRFSPSTTATTSDLYPGPAKSTYGPAPGAIAPLERPAVPLTSTPDYRSAAGSVPEQPPLYSPPVRGGTRFNSGVSDVTTNPAAPTYDPPAGGYAPAPSGYGSGGYAQPRTALEPPPTQYAPPNYAAHTAGQPPQLPPNYPPTVNYAPAAAPPDRMANLNRPAATTNTAAPLSAPQISTASSTKSSAESSQGDKPWVTMVIFFALALSIGANMYLGWTAGEYYSRYRLATERLRSASRA
jgi:hypothetical protein